VNEIATHCNDAPVEDALDDSCQVIGHSHKDIAFVMAESKQNLPSHAKPLATSLGLMNKTEQYYTIFMEHLEVVGFNETAIEDISEEAWYSYLIGQNKDNNMRVIVNKGAFVLASFPIDVDVPRVLKLPRNSVFFPVLLTGFKARSNTTSTVLANVGRKLKKDAAIVQMIESIKASEVKEFIEELTKTNTRNSYSQGATEAANEIQNLFQSLGYTSVLEPFDERFGPNVIVRIVGEVNPEKWGE
jgi:hypothetical protein